MKRDKKHEYDHLYNRCWAGQNQGQGQTRQTVGAVLSEVPRPVVNQTINLFGDTVKFLFFNHIGSRDLIMPALFLWIKSNPNKPEQNYEC